MPTSHLSAHFFDADGSFFNKEWMRLKNYAALIDSHLSADDQLMSRVLFSNLPLFEAIKTQIAEENPAQCIVGSFSNRQSESIDSEMNRMNKTGSFYATLEKIKNILHKYKPTSLEKMSLSDFFSNKRPGFAFEQALSSPDLPSYPRAPLDQSKFILIYTILHHLAFQYPDSQLKVSCYDDRCEILGSSQLMSYPACGRILTSHFGKLLERLI